MQQTKAEPVMSASPDISDEKSVKSGRETVAVKQNAESDKKPVYLPYTHIAIPEFAAGAVRSFGHFVDERRKATITALPSPIVNNSSNVIGSMQLVAEVLMYKSSGNNLTNDKTKPLWHQVLVQPVKNIYGGALSRSKFNFDLNALTKADSYRNAWKNLSDIEVASKRDIAIASADPEAAFKSAVDARSKLSQFKGLSKEVVEADLKEALKKPNAPTLGKLSNKWSVRSGLAGITAMTVTTLLPDEKDTPEITEKMINKATNDPLGYVGLRLYQAVNPLEWFEHKRQFAGLGMMGAGVFSFISGFRQVAGKYGLDAQRYLKNPWQMAGGAITTIAGSQLMLGVDSQQAWTNFGTTQITRLTTLPSSIHFRFKYNEQGGNWYMGAQTILQMKNFVAALIGGAEKMPDGTIVDHKKVREDLSSKIYAEHKEKKRHNKKMVSTQLGSDEAILSNQPENKISAADNVQLAMPKRRAEAAAQEVA